MSFHSLCSGLKVDVPGAVLSSRSLSWAVSVRSRKVMFMDIRRKDFCYKITLCGHLHKMKLCWVYVTMH